MADDKMDLEELYRQRSYPPIPTVILSHYVPQPHHPLQTDQTTLPFLSTSSTISGASVPLSVRPISAAKVLCGTHLAEFLGVVSSIIRSTCSRERPLVSGIKKYAYMKQQTQRAPQTKNTLGPRLPSSLSTM